MSKVELNRVNNDRIVIQSYRQHWQITYYSAAPVRRNWRRLFGDPVLFRQQATSVAEIHGLLLRRGLALSRAEALRLSSLLNVQTRFDASGNWQPA